MNFEAGGSCRGGPPRVRDGDRARGRVADRPGALISGRVARVRVRAMPYFVVNSYHGPAWVEGRPMREQAGWPAHRDFMNSLPDGFVLLGGPVDGHRNRAMLIVRGTDISEVHGVLDPDPWVRSGTLVEVIEPWEILVSDARVDPVLERSA